jgi:hypothetical protein
MDLADRTDATIRMRNRDLVQERLVIPRGPVDVNATRLRSAGPRPGGRGTSVLHQRRASINLEADATPASPRTTCRFPRV